jgi:hypothetical protein
MRPDARTRFALAGLLLFALSLAPRGAQAVLIATGDGTGNTTAPADDPGFANVGTRDLQTALYLGNRWVLTANHVGFGNAVFGGVTYTAVAGSKLRLVNPNATNADLQMFKIIETPPLPPLEIADTAPPIGAEVVLIGHGRNRGAATSYTFGGETWEGWIWGGGHAMRWGTNTVASAPASFGSTWGFTTAFDPIASGGPPHEAQAAIGDSGGGVFLTSGGVWRLVGVLYARDVHPGQPPETSLYGNPTWAANLATYRAQIVARASMPGCADGLDDDADGLTDFPADPGCQDALDAWEQHACSDGVDNDLDGLVDYPGDPGCSDANDHREMEPSERPAQVTPLRAESVRPRRPAL